MKVYMASYFWDSDAPDDEDDFRLVGFYSTQEKAQLALEKAQQRSELARGPGDFAVSTWIVDQAQWVEGFTTWAEALDALRNSENDR